MQHYRTWGKRVWLTFSCERTLDVPDLTRFIVNLSREISIKIKYFYDEEEDLFVVTNHI